MKTPRDLARALGGDPTPKGASVPGPGHSRRDRSLSIELNSTAPEGFIVYSHAQDDWALCRDYVREKLGLARPREIKRRPPSARPNPAQRLRPAPEAEEEDDEWALKIWRTARPRLLHNAEVYFGLRRLVIDPELVGRVLRQHPVHGI